MLNQNQIALVEFVQEFSPALPVRRRVRVLLGAAQGLPDKEIRRSLVQRASILEQAEAKCRELDLKFNGELSGDGHGNGGKS